MFFVFLITILNFVAFRGQETSCTARHDCYNNGYESPHFKEYLVDGIDRSERDSTRDVSSSQGIDIREIKKEIEYLKNNMQAMKLEGQSMLAGQEKYKRENNQDILKLEEKLQVMENVTAALDSENRVNKLWIERLEERIRSLISNSVELGASLGAITSATTDDIQKLKSVCFAGEAFQTTAYKLFRVFELIRERRSFFEFYVVSLKFPLY